MPLEVPPELAEGVRAHWGERLPADCIIDDASGGDDAPGAEERL